MNNDQMIDALREANRVAQSALDEGKHPFGAVLLAPDGQTLLMKQGNVDTVKHAETELARAAAQKYDADYLWNCALVTNFEPCVMCMGTLYWANIGTVVYGVKESKLLELTGSHEENPTLNMPCEAVVAAGQKPIQVYGPFSEVEEETLALHQDFWS